MSVADIGIQRDVQDREGDSVAVSSLSRFLDCGLALETDSRATTGEDSRRDRRAPEGLPRRPSGGGAGLPDRVPEAVGERWLSFAGVPAAQRIQDYFLWEVLLNEHPHLTGIVELGTWKGGFSLYLAAQARYRGLCFRTYDVAAPDREIPGFVQLDIFRWSESIGETLREWEPVIVLCDGGNKPRELKTFSRYVTAESLLVVHDWGTEMLASDVPDNVEMVYGDFCESIASMSRVFRVA